MPHDAPTPTRPLRALLLVASGLAGVMSGGAAAIAWKVATTQAHHAPRAARPDAGTRLAEIEERFGAGRDRVPAR